MSGFTTQVERLAKADGYQTTVHFQPNMDAEVVLVHDPVGPSGFIAVSASGLELVTASTLAETEALSKSRYDNAILILKARMP